MGWSWGALKSGFPPYTITLFFMTPTIGLGIVDRLIALLNHFEAPREKYNKGVHLYQCGMCCVVHRSAGTERLFFCWFML